MIVEDALLRISPYLFSFLINFLEGVLEDLLEYIERV